MKIFSAFRFPLSVFVAVLLIPASTNALSDIDEYEYKSAIEFLESQGIVEGYLDGTFRPYKPINRAEFLKLLMLSVYGTQMYQAPSGICFTDFVTYQWFWPYACGAKQLGVIHGHPDGTFRGEDTIILAEALKMSLEAWNAELPPDDITRPWYERYMAAAASRDIFRRFPYTPEYQLTRGEMAQLLVMLGEPIAAVDPNAVPNTTTVSVPFPTHSTCGDGLTQGSEQCDDGNLLDGDGCSKICVLVAEPIRHGALRIEQQVVSNTPQSSGNRDVPLFAFTGIAGRQDVYITTLKFTSAAGSLQNAENYRLFIDKDGNGIVESLYGKGTADSESLTFDNLNILVRDGVYMRVELWADIDTSLTPGSVAVAFDTSDLNFVEGQDRIDGEDVSGIQLNTADCTLETICWITVITDTDQTFTIGTKGNLYVTEDTSPIGPRQVVASTETPSILVLKFRSESEDIRIKKLAIEGVPDSVEHLEFLASGTSQPFALGRKISCSVVAAGRYCSDKEFVVPKNGSKIVIVKALLKSDVQGAISGQSMALVVSAVTSGNVAVLAEGFDSGQQLAQNDGDTSAEGEIFIGTTSMTSNIAITGPVHTIVLAKIADITNGSTDPDGSPIITGGMTIAKFNFRAADNENTKDGLNVVGIDKLTFTVSAVNVQFDSSSFMLYNTLNSSTVHLCTATGTTGTITVVCSSLLSGQVNTLISPEDTVHLALRGNITNAQLLAGSSILQVSLNSLGNPNVTGTVEWEDEETTLGWVDISNTVVRSTSYRLN